MKTIFTILSLVLISLLLFPLVAQAQHFHIRLAAITPSIPMTRTPTPTQRILQNTHIQRRLASVNGSGVTGIVDLMQLPNNSGTFITVIGFGLQPNNQYVSLYYSNHVCNLEPYSVNDVIGGMYTANIGGVGTTQASQEDNLVDINSVSIRNAGTFHLLACANIHP